MKKISIIFANNILFVAGILLTISLLVILGIDIFATTYIMEALIGSALAWVAIGVIGIILLLISTENKRESSNK
jgi:hypothetical protein